MIAVVNNCLHAMELSHQMNSRNSKTSDSNGIHLAVLNSFESIVQTYEVGT